MITGDLMCAVDHQRKCASRQFDFHDSFNPVRKILTEADFSVGVLKSTCYDPEPYEFEQNIEMLDSKALRKMKGILVRDYNAGVADVQNGREQLVSFLQKLLRMEQFQDEFYRKPLEAMLDVSKEAKKVLSQLEITIKAYDSLMDKILIDIAMIEKEKNMKRKSKSIPRENIENYKTKISF